MKQTTHGRDRRRPAFTILELIVVVALIVVVSAILLPTIHKTRHVGESNVRCSANLSTIYKAMYLYSAADRSGSFPRTLFAPGDPPTFHWDASPGGNPVNPFVDKPWADYSNDVVMAIFLIIRTQRIPSEVFLCPGAEGQKDLFGKAAVAAEMRDWNHVAALDKASFTKPANLSYSFQNMYPDPAAEQGGFKWNNAISSEFAIAADQNPGIGDDHDVTFPADPTAPTSAMQKANSRNHHGLGQNVLYGDGHVQFENNPFQGIRHDNIYTVSGSDDGTITTSKIVVGSPRYFGDSVLLPPFK